MAAYRAVDGWVRALAVPETLPNDLIPAFGAHVMLRLDGQVVGRGTAVSQRIDGATTWRAAREAIAQARSRLPRATDLVQQEAAATDVGRLTISLELAGPPTPVVPAPDTLAQVELAYAPALDGVAVRIGDGPDAALAAVFPSQMMSTGLSPGRALAVAASQAAGDATAGLAEPKELREKHGATLLKFRTVHLAQCTPGAEPIFLSRGMRRVPMEAMTVDGLRDMGARIVRHLGAVAASGAPTATGSVPEALLALAAAGRFASVVGANAPGGPLQEEIRSISRWAARAAEAERPAPAAAVAAVESAMRIVAIDLRREPWPAADPGRFDGDPPMPTEMLAAARAALDRVVAPDGTVDPEVPAGARAMLACALVGIARAEHAAGAPLTGVPPTIEVAEAAVRRLLRETPAELLVSHMPWLGWAELRLAALKAEIAGAPAGAAPIPAAVALRRMREQVWGHMLTEADCGPDNADLVGGIIFNRTKVLFPTWQSARPLAFIATMLGDERLTEPREFNGELVRLLSALRFLRQLQADESTMWMYAGRDHALGGIRAAAWDRQTPLDASAMTLLAIAEALHAIERRAAAGVAREDPAARPALPATAPPPRAPGQPTVPPPK